MSKLPAVTANEAIEAFSRFGFVPEPSKRRGSHRVLCKPGHQYHLTIPYHGHQTLKAGTLRSLIRDAGITQEQFIDGLG